MFNLRRPSRLQRPALPPGPRRPALAQLASYLRCPTGFLVRARQRYGPVFTVRWPGLPPLVYFAEDAAIREILHGDPELLQAGRSNSVLDFVAGPRSVARLDGAEHRQRRRQLMVPFSRAESHVAQMSENTLQRANATSEQRISFSSWSQALALQNLIDCTIGFSDPQHAAALNGLVLEFIDRSLNPVMAALWMTLPGDALRRGLVRYLAPLSSTRLRKVVPFSALAGTIRALDTLIYSELASQRRAAQRGDQDGIPKDVLLNTLLQSTTTRGGHGSDSGCPFGRGVSDADLRDEVMGMLIAGHETTSTTMDWFVVEALCRPRVLANLRRELDDVIGDAPVSAAALPKLKYLTAVLYECMRLHPPVPAVGRYVTRDTTIAGVSVPRGVVASPSFILQHLDPTLWANPLDFRPERFLENTGAAANLSLPFGGGHRMCPGRSFALVQLKTTLATVLSQFDLVPERWPTPHLAQRGLFTGVSHPVELTIRPRRARRAMPARSVTSSSERSCGKTPSSHPVQRT